MSLLFLRWIMHTNVKKTQYNCEYLKENNNSFSKKNFKWQIFLFISCMVIQIVHENRKFILNEKKFFFLHTCLLIPFLEVIVSKIVQNNYFLINLMRGIYPVCWYFYFLCMHTHTFWRITLIFIIVLLFRWCFYYRSNTYLF